MSKRIIHLFENIYVDPDEVESFKPVTDNTRTAAPYYSVRVKMKSGDIHQSESSYGPSAIHAEIVLLINKIDSKEEGVSIVGDGGRFGG